MPPTPQRWLGVDHGTRRIGLAVGVLPEGITTPLAVIPAEPQDRALAEIVERAREYQAAGIVVGLPLNMDGTEGPQAKLVRGVAEALARRTETPVRTWDERLSSFAADQTIAGLYTRKQKKARQDAVAAASMLSDFLAALADGRAADGGDAGGTSDGSGQR